MKFTITMDMSNITTIAQLAELAKQTAGTKKKTYTMKERVDFIEAIAKKFKYQYKSTKRPDKSRIIRACKNITGLSETQVKRWFANFKKHKGKIVRGSIETRREACKKNPRFQCKYTATDIALLVEIDNLYMRPSGPITKSILNNMVATHGDLRYVNIASISSSHIYNLRETLRYTSHALTVAKTKAVSTPIGIRQKPRNGGMPGFLRVDTVHQGDSKDGKKGVYWIHLVDEITQWAIVVAVERIVEETMEEVLEIAIELFPFKILNFHSDNGGEYINYTVSELLQKLIVKQTKSRARRSGDNGMIESKHRPNIRTYFGYGYIPREMASEIDTFLKEHHIPFLNFHRPCFFPSYEKDPKKDGKLKKVYKTVRTPFHQLCLIPEVAKYLREGVTLEKLHAKETELDSLTVAKNRKNAWLQIIKKLPNIAGSSVSFMD